MKKLFFLPLLLTATMVFADVRVEDFTIKSGGTTGTYVTTETSRECSQATWTFFSGGLRTDVGNFNSCAAVVRAKKASETITPYFVSDSISDGIDSLWFTWNSNGNETAGTWNVKIYINNDSVGCISEQGNAKDATPSRKFHVGNLKKTGKFVIKVINESAYTGDGTGNTMRFVFDDLSWNTYTPGEKNNPQLAFASKSLIKYENEAAFTNELTNNSDATPIYDSSEPSVATVDQNGQVTIIGVGYTTITASVEETENYKAGSVSYELRVVSEKWKKESFSKAKTTSSYAAEEETAVGDAATWKCLLGGINTNENFAPYVAMLRAPRTNESKSAYIESDSIEGGIAYLNLEWNMIGNEANVKNWDIRFLINSNEVKRITNEAGDVLEGITGRQTDMTALEIPNINIGGKFVIRIENHSIIKDDVTYTSGNMGRFVIDNLEWEGYEGTPSTIDNTNVQREIRKEMINGQLIINIDGVRYNMQGQQL